MSKAWVGIDIGSVSYKAVVIGVDDKIIKSYYTKNHGLLETTKEVMQKIRMDDLEVCGVGCTGSGREFVSHIIGCDVVESEIISHYIATTTIFPSVSTIIDIGGEDSKLLIIEDGNLTNFNMNNECSGGTGAMIEAIANRIGVKIEDVGDIALTSKNDVSMPSKCGIFAQSAVVTKINKGVPKEDILMGILRGLVGNYFAILCKGKTLRPPYVFQGATAKNKALIRCMSDELHSEVIIPEHPELMGALGVAIIAKNDIQKTVFKGFDHLNNNFTTSTYYANGCTNKCEITKIMEDNQLIGHIGNRCDKCIIRG